MSLWSVLSRATLIGKKPFEGWFEVVACVAGRLSNAELLTLLRTCRTFYAYRLRLRFPEPIYDAMLYKVGHIPYFFERGALIESILPLRSLPLQSPMHVNICYRYLVDHLDHLGGVRTMVLNCLSEGDVIHVHSLPKLEKLYVLAGISKSLIIDQPLRKLKVRGACRHIKFVSAVSLHTQARNFQVIDPLGLKTVRRLRLSVEGSTRAFTVPSGVTRLRVDGDGFGSEPITVPETVTYLHLTCCVPLVGASPEVLIAEGPSFPKVDTGRLRILMTSADHAPSIRLPVLEKLILTDRIPWYDGLDSQAPNLQTLVLCHYHRFDSDVFVVPLIQYRDGSGRYIRRSRLGIAWSKHGDKALGLVVLAFLTAVIGLLWKRLF